MNTVRITAIRQTVYPDLIAQYENPIEHACDIRQGQQWISINGKRPEGLCPSAWESMRPFVESLAQGKIGGYEYGTEIKKKLLELEGNPTKTSVMRTRW